MIRWAHEGFTYVQFGLVQIAANDQLCASGKQYADPPVYHPDVMAWLEAHPHCERWDVGAIGPPVSNFRRASWRTNSLRVSTLTASGISFTLNR